MTRSSARRFRWTALAVLALGAPGALSAQDSPAPVSTSTPQRSSTSSASRTSFISRFMAGFMALRLSGRFMATQAMPSSNSTRTELPHGSSTPSALPLPAVPVIARSPFVMVPAIACRCDVPLRCRDHSISSPSIWSDLAGREPGG